MQKEMFDLATRDSRRVQNRFHVVLSREIARAIFVLKKNHGVESSNQASIRLAKLYHVSAKSIRDIWNGKSWLAATSDLWDEEERPIRRAVGRPKGRKDDKPRVQRQTHAVVERDPERSYCLYRDIFGSKDDLSGKQPPSIENFVPLKGSSLPSLAPETTAAQFNPKPQEAWSVTSRAEQTAYQLPRFEILMQGIGFVSALRNSSGPYSIIST
jgi:hypothetical protein